ncbi:hypothetical protein AK88_04280 [Plasmodium fragile]|uniref:Schizont-infected cell agglutination C-terminal domain-containing protein n=1 Tax=Plasmodium fragile TaxID=5857 RepID=A0A0D9QGG7_PLAFR|nr:uncharacterized protein AK88_04280 [Plasmodium fragile]KJP86089.1 hypothetical protein AK88_04280 [Plasmodium fragile]
MWNYLIVLWEDYIAKGDTGWKDKNIKDRGKNFWEHVKTVWAQFNEYVQQEQDDGRARIMCAAGRDGEQGAPWTSEDMGICELTYIALDFKHDMDSVIASAASGTLDSAVDEDAKMKSYIKCFLVNVFMKKIMGKKCLQTLGGQWAFNSANGMLKGFGGVKVGNISCEEKDAGEGGIPVVKAEDRTFWQIMDRWFEDNRVKLKDGDYGLLGNDCKVERAGTARVNDLKNTVKEEVRTVGKEIEQKVDKIKERIKECTGTEINCVKTLLQEERDKEKNQQDSSSKPAEANGQSRPPGPSQGTQASSTPGGSDKKEGLLPPQKEAEAAPEGRSEEPAQPPPSRPPPPAPPPATTGGAAVGQRPAQQPPLAAPPRPQQPEEGEKNKEKVEDTDVQGKDTKTTEDQWDFLDNIDPLPGEERPDPRITDETDQYRGKGPVGIPGSTRVIDISKGTSPDISGAPPAVNRTLVNHAAVSSTMAVNRVAIHLTKFSFVMHTFLYVHSGSQAPPKACNAQDHDTQPTASTASAGTTKSIDAGEHGDPNKDKGQLDGSQNESKHTSSPAVQHPSSTPSAAAPAGHSPAPGEADDKVADGGNDDPPPLNPPKPKPETTNPDQSGSSPSGSSGGTGPGVGGVSGGEGKGGGGGEKAAGGTGSGSAGPGGRSGAGVSGGASGSGAVPGATGAAGVGHGGGGGATGGEPGAGSVDAGPGSTGHQTPGSSGPGSTRTSQPGSSGSVSTGHQPPGSSKPGSDPSTQPNNAQGTGSKPTDPDGGFGLSLDRAPAVGNIGEGYAPATPTEKTSGNGDMNSGAGPDGPDLTADILTATAPVLFFLSAVTVAFLGYSLWKYFAYLGQKRRRTYRTVRDVPSPPLDEDILQHLQRGPPPDYGYTMVKATQPASTSGRGRPPRVHKRTIIELHLEVLHQCEATEWENVKDDYLQILVEEFAQECARDPIMCSRILDVPTSHASITTHDSTTRHTPTDIDGTNPLPPNEDDPDPWRCMKNIQLEQERTHAPPLPSSGPGNECPTSDCTPWINWIDRNKHMLRECTTQPWFLQLKVDWKQYLRAHMLATEDNVVSAHREFGEAATPPMKKLDLWRQWVAQQHAQVRMYNAEEWFQHLWSNIEETGVVTEEDGMPQQIRTVEGVSHIHTVDEKPTTFVTEQGPPVEKGLAVEEALQGGSALKVRHLPQQQLHPELYRTKPLTALKLWTLLLASVIEECERERSLQDKELYVDDLLQQC